MNQLRVLITTPWTAQGLTTLSMRLARFMTSLGHKVGLHAWRKSYQAIGVPEDRDVYLGPFEKAINDYDLVIWPEVVEADQVQHARSLGKLALWIPMWEYCQPDLVDTYQKFDHIVAPTHACHALLDQLGVPGVRCIPWALLDELREPRPTGDELTWLHCVRGLSGDMRNTTAVLQAWHSHKRNGGRGCLLVKSLARLNQFVDPTLVDLVRVLPGVEIIEGAIPYADVLALYDRADLFVYPTKREGIGCVLLEALGRGVPVITTNAAPMNEIVEDGFNGRLIPCRPGMRFNGVTEQEVEVDALAECFAGMTPVACHVLKATAQNGVKDQEANFVTQWSGLLNRLAGNRPQSPLMIRPAGKGRENEQEAAICMVTCDRLHLTKKTVASVECQTAGHPYRWIIADNGSTDGSLAWLRHRAWPVPATIVRYPHNKGKARAMNVAMYLAHEAGLPVIVMLDNDVALPTEWLGLIGDALYRFPSVGQIGVNFEPIGYPPTTLNSGRQLCFKTAGCINGAAVGFRRELVDALGYHYEGYGLYGHLDVDWTLRCRMLGLSQAYLPVRGLHLDRCAGDEEYEQQKRQAMELGQTRWHARSVLYATDRTSIHVPFPPAITGHPTKGGLVYEVGHRDAKRKSGV